jgi:spore coat protein CotH
MRKRSWGVATALTFGAVAVGAWFGLPIAKAPAADQNNQAAAKSANRGFFGLTKIHQFHLDLSAKEWEKMQPKGGGGFPFGGRPGGPGARPGAPGAAPAGQPKPGEQPADVHRGGSFGIEFPWAHANFTAEGETHKDVGLRYKGGGSYVMTANRLKRNLKVELDRYDENGRFHGMKSVNLNAGAMDPTRMREALAFEVFRASGVPAPRTAFAEVTLTVPGKYDKELVGLYTVIEQVDRTFLKDRFKNGKGLLLKPEVGRSMRAGLFGYLGEDWERYKGAVGAKHEATKKEAQRYIEFARLLQQASDEKFQKEVGSYLDVEEFLRFFACTALLSNLDNIFFGHNAYIYLNPETNKFVFIPWDMDLSFGGFFMFGSPDQQADLSFTHPYTGQNKLVDRLFASKEVSERYQKIVKELLATSFNKEKLLKEAEAIEKATKTFLDREKKAVDARKEPQGGFAFGPPPGGPGAGPTSLKTFVEKRTELVMAQLEGKSKGFVPAMGFGGRPGGRPGGGPGGFGMGNFMAKPLLEALDADKDGKVSKDELIAGVKQFFKDSDKDKKGHLDEQTLAAGLNRVFPRPPGFGPPGGGPGGPPGGPPPGGGPGGPPGGGPGGPPRGGFGGPPGGFGPGTFLAGAVIRRADADKDGKVTLDELVAAAEALFKEADKNKDGKLDEKELGEAINLLTPPPQGFGPPGGRQREPRPEPKKDDKKEEKKP